MRKYCVTVRDVATKLTSYYWTDDKKAANDFANYYRRKNSNRDKKYIVTQETNLI